MINELRIQRYQFFPVIGTASAAFESRIPFNPDFIGDAPSAVREQKFAGVPRESCITVAGVGDPGDEELGSWSGITDPGYRGLRIWQAERLPYNGFAEIECELPRRRHTGALVS